MLRYLPLALLIFSLIGCGTTKIQPVAVDPAAHSDHFTGEEKDAKSTRKKRAPQKLVVDNSRPATYEQYRQWRQNNDPDSQTYADYKAWEAAYKRWQKEQSAATEQ